MTAGGHDAHLGVLKVEAALLRREILQKSPAQHVEGRFRDCIRPFIVVNEDADGFDGVKAGK
jgi:hypothetical protein